MPGVLELNVVDEVTLAALLVNETIEGLKLTVSPVVGDVVPWDNATLPVKPNIPDTVAVKVAVELAGKLTLLLLSDTLKSVTFTRIVTGPMRESVNPDPAASLET